MGYMLIFCGRILRNLNICQLVQGELRKTTLSGYYYTESLYTTSRLIARSQNYGSGLTYANSMDYALSYRRILRLKYLANFKNTNFVL